MVSFATIGSADTSWAQLVSWFPLTAPLAMPNRIAMGAATWWDPLVAVVLTLVAIAGLVVLGGRIYDRAILHTGSTLSLGEAWRGAPAPSHAGGATGPAEVEPAPASATAAASSVRTRRVQVILGLVSLALGGVVFAVTADFVIGVAVGAGFFALAVRGMQAWSRQAPQPDSPPQLERESRQGPRRSGSYRSATTVMTATLDQRLSVQADAGAFDEAEVAGADESVRRYFRAAIAPGTSLARAARLRMHGSIKLTKRWVPFRADELLAPLQGYYWPAKVAGGLLRGSDQYADGNASMLWKLLGLVPIVRCRRTGRRT